MKVEELSQYGKTLSDIPKEALKKQKAIVFHEIRMKFGLLGILPFFIRLLLEQRALKKNYPLMLLPEKKKERTHTSL